MPNDDNFFSEPESSYFDKPNPVKVLKLIYASNKNFFKEKPGIIILSAILVLFLFGFHGELDLLQFVFKDWSDACVISSQKPAFLQWIPWNRAFISFIGGALLLVGIPALIIHFCFKQPLSNYGLGLPPKGKRMMAGMIFITLLIPFSASMFVAAKNPCMEQVYPIYKSFSSIPQFFLYELTYLPFFVAIEFIFRGYLLFGLADNGFSTPGKGGVVQTFYFGRYAIIISMLSYNTWHLGKPLTEMWATPLWGLVAGACTYSVRSIWPVMMVHWLSNVLLDALILHHLKLLFC